MNSLLKKITTFALLLVLSSVWSFSQTTIDPALFVKNLMQKYSAESFSILDQAENTPRNFEFDGGSAMNFDNKYNITDYLKTNTLPGILNDVNAAVHEMTHDYTGVLAYKKLKEKGVTNIGLNSYLCFVPEINNEIVVKITKNFPSSELGTFIEDDYQTERFASYVFPSRKILGTQINGIYGLLDEFHAYYHGTKAMFDLRGYFENELDQTAENWAYYFREFYATYYAYAEFKFFILKYLLYAKEKHPEMYESIMANQDFKNAFIETDKSFSKMINNFGQVKSEILANLKSKGIAVSETTDQITLDSKFAITQNETYNFFLQALNKKELTDMMALLSSTKIITKKEENTKSVELQFDATSMAESFGGVKNVTVIGSFNDFDVTDTRFAMTPVSPGSNVFTITMNLKPGKYLYKLNIDGMFLSDMTSAGFMLIPAPEQFEKDKEGGASAVLIVK